MDCYNYILYLISCDYYNNDSDIELGKTLLEEHCNNSFTIDNKFDCVNEIINHYENNIYYQPYYNKL